MKLMRAALLPAIALSLAPVLAQGPPAPAGASPAVSAPGPAGQAPEAGGRRGGRGGRGGGDPFAGQPRVKALVISGGCCHDYPAQNHILVDALRRVLPVDWTIAYQGGNGTRGVLPVYETADWASRFDIVVHNECFADNQDEAVIRRIVEAHRRVPAVVLHCAMHSYRSAPTADLWREFLGVTTVRHTRAHQISVKLAAGSDAVLGGFKPDWVTPVDELYVIDKFWPEARALATAVSPEDQKEYPLIWTSTYQGARVFGTTLGHGMATWEDPVFQDLVARGFRWAAGRGE